MYVSRDYNINQCLLNLLVFLCVCAFICMHGWTCVGVCFTASGPVERVYLSAPIVTIRGKEANLTAVVWPSHTRTLTFFWWFDNSSEVRSLSSSSSSPHYCSINTFCPVYCNIFHSLTLFLMLLCCLQFHCVNLQHFSHKSCKM